MIYNAALYCRLSKDDNDLGCDKTESSSITTQKEMLLRYAKEQGVNVYNIYTDDGYSGTDFNRPAFLQMKKDIEAGMVNMVITKDLSRLGRDYIINGELIENYFPKHKIRYIAITDAYDSNDEYNDIAPFKNVVNELYARDISKKIRSALITKMKEGKYVGSFPPFGYKKDPNNKNRLIINTDCAFIVEEIFRLAKAGKRPKDIAEHLNLNGVPTPSEFRMKQHPYHEFSDHKTVNGGWTSAGIQKILKNECYIGNTVQHKTTKLSFKSHITLDNKKEDWIVVDNTHEAIIDRRDFEIVQTLMYSRRNPPKSGFKSIFSGIAKCADCGSNMSATGTRKKESTYNLVCGKYKLWGSKACSNHFVDYDELYALVLNALNKYLRLTEGQRHTIAESLQSRERATSSHESSDRSREIQARLCEISAVTKGLYEDKYLGKISEDRFSAMMKTYDAEEVKLKMELKSLHDALNASNDKKANDFCGLLKGMTELTELDIDIVNTMIDRIVIHQGHYKTNKNGVRKKQQKVEIYLKFMPGADSIK